MKIGFELWQITHQWLNLCGNKISKNYIKEDLTTHPDYPTLLSVADFLDQGNFRYKALKADSTQIDKFNYPLLAHIKHNGQEQLQIIKNSQDWNSDTINYWSGVVLYPELNTKWVNIQNSNYLNVEYKNKLISFFMILIAISLVIYSSFSASNSIFQFSFGILSLTGLVISILLLGMELGYQGQIVKQVCGAVSNDGCEKVLKSVYSKGVIGITPSDASLIYFFTQFVIYLISSYNINYFSGILLFSFLGLFVAIWSIYTQIIKIKQYCVLCLGVGSVLLLQFLILYFYYYNDLFHYILLLSSGILLYLFVSLIGLMMLIPIKNLIKTNKGNKVKLAELKWLKLDADFFINQLKQEQLVDVVVWENDLILGNPKAPIMVTVACNLYCNPCARTHKKLDELLNKHAESVKLQIRLACKPDDSNDIKTISSSKILQKYIEVNNNLIQQKMLNDWFSWMDLGRWNSYWEPKNNIDVEDILKMHEQWFKTSLISHTPTLFVNGRKLPKIYSIEDLNLLIPQIVSKL